MSAKQAGPAAELDNAACAAGQQCCGIRSRVCDDRGGCPPCRELGRQRTAVATALAVAARAERGALRWADPLPVPRWVGEIRSAVAAVLDGRALDGWVHGDGTPCPDFTGPDLGFAGHDRWWCTDHGQYLYRPPASQEAPSG